MVNVVSYAFFKSEASAYHKDKNGDSPKQFEQFFPLLFAAHHVVWGEDWQVRVHHDEVVKNRSTFQGLQRMEKVNRAHLVPMGAVQNIGLACLWRLAPVFDPAVNVVAMRDIDTIPTTRDSACVAGFMSYPSNVVANLIHDNPSHSGLMTGMLAFRAEEFRKAIKINTWDKFLYWCNSVYTVKEWDTQGSEQRFLNEHVLPKLGGSIFHYALGAEVRDVGAAHVLRQVPELPGRGRVKWVEDLSPGIGVCDYPDPALAEYWARGYN